MASAIREIQLSWAKGIQTTRVSTDEAVIRTAFARINPKNASRSMHNADKFPYLVVEEDDEVDEYDMIDMNVWLLVEGDEVPYDHNDDDYDVEYACSFEHDGKLFHVYYQYVAPE